MMPERRLYVVTIGGLPHTLSLSAEDAERYGDRAVEVKQAESQNKSRKPTDKSAAVSKK